MFPMLELYGVYDRGVPNHERIVLRSNGLVDLSQYCLTLGVRAPMNQDKMFPIPDHFLWLGNRYVAPNSWVFIYTGTGEPTVTQETTTKQPVQTIFWNKPTVIFDHPEIVPALSTYADLQIGNKENRSVHDVYNRPVDTENDFLTALLGTPLQSKAPPKK